jgi:tRNA-dihydrouridine synthase
LKNPFIFEQAASLWSGKSWEPVEAGKYQDLLQELRGLLEEEPCQRSMLHAKKFLAWFASGFSGCHGFRSKIFSIASDEDLWEEAFRFFDSQDAREESFDLSFLAGGHG